MRWLPRWEQAHLESAAVIQRVTIPEATPPLLPRLMINRGLEPTVRRDRGRRLRHVRLGATRDEPGDGWSRGALPQIADADLWAYLVPTNSMGAVTGTISAQERVNAARRELADARS